MILRPEHSRAHFLAVLIALAGVLFSGCGSSESPEDVADAEFLKLEQQMGTFVEQLISASLSATTEEAFQYQDGREGVRRVRILETIALPEAAWSPEGAVLLETPGEVVREIPLQSNSSDRRPWPLLIDDSGTLLLGREDGVLVHSPEGSPEGDSRLIAMHRPAALHWNEDGSLLLVDSTDAKRLILWPAGTPEIDLLEEGFRARLVFSRRGGNIWQVTDLIDPDPSSEVRVLITSVRERAPGGSVDEELLESPTPLAGLGTLPLVGQAWGHRLRAGMILPRPAPIWLLSDNLRPSQRISDPGDDVDLAPASSSAGTVVFIRTRRLIDTEDGLLLSTNARAWQTDLESEASQRPLTGEPTYAVAISPNGEHLTFLVERAGRLILLRSTPEGIASSSPMDSIAAMRAFEDQVQRVLARVREEWAESEWHQILEAESVSYDQPLENASKNLAEMARTLRAALAAEHGLLLPVNNRESIGLLDAWLKEADGLIAEENATILAIGGLYGELLAEESGVAWDTAAILPSLSNDLMVPTEQEGQLYRLHSPFTVAREAISGRLSLLDAAAEALGDGRLPVGLVENFGDRARAGFALSELERVGVPMEGEVPTSVWRGIVENHPANMIANEAAWSAATARAEGGIAFAAAMNMAEHNPSDPQALLRFARELLLAGLDDAAIRLFEHAEELSPDDADVRLAVATAYFDVYRLDEAELRFLRIADHFPGELEIVLDNLSVLHSLRADEGSTAALDGDDVLEGNDAQEGEE